MTKKIANSTRNLQNQILKSVYDLIETRAADPKLLISDPDPTWRVISDPDPDPARWSFRIWIQIQIPILPVKFFVKFSNLKSECTFKGHFCAEIQLFMLKIVFLSLQLFYEKHDP